ncbi:ATP-binding protein [Pseudokineococcus sp. 5B2Z-1]|uniref:ATP-binding protein n=1 Tax=Pseudokineococcus sp. 5B2Z-1 TaxID=3132744 RepID=UPI0030B5588F
MGGRREDAARASTSSTRRTFPPRIEAVRWARGLVEDALVAVGLGHLADDAGLLVSELAGNAVLHARTSFEVAVLPVEAGARVEVSDGSAVLPVSTAPSATATMGRGLLLVRRLSSGWGARETGDGEVVWFEVDGRAVDDADLSVEDLLAAWDDEGPAAGAPGGGAVAGRGAVDEEHVVVVPDVPARELLAAKEHMDDLLRELQLVLLDVGGRDGTRAPSAQRTGDVVRVAAGLDAAARAFDGVRRQVREQVSRSVVAGEERVSLHLRVAPGVVADAVAYRAAVEAAEVLAAAGGLLTTGGLERHAVVRRRYLDEVVRRAGAR